MNENNSGFAFTVIGPRVSLCLFFYLLAIYNSFPGGESFFSLGIAPRGDPGELCRGTWGALNPLFHKRLRMFLRGGHRQDPPTGTPRQVPPSTGIGEGPVTPASLTLI